MTRFVDNPGSETRSYTPSFFAAGDGLYLSDAHRTIEQNVDGIRGKLEPADHLKLYEAGYFARGPMLEIGRLHGRSTTVIACGIREAGHSHRLTSIEYESRYLAPSAANLERFGVRDFVDLLQGDSSEVVRGLGAKFDTVFVDGDHSYEGVKRDLDALATALTADAVVMFHDYYHPANETGEYGVRRAVEESAGDLGLSFRGRSGGIALFERGG